MQASVWHGLLGEMEWEHPVMAARSSQAARPGYYSCTATEYLDTPQVLKEKVALLGAMWKRSGPDTVIYSGAGLSTAAGIGDYASKAVNSLAPHKAAASSSSFESTGSRLTLKPTIAHHALASIHEKGFIGHWVQQNHDRLAQKAGFPQAKLNEIHGAWGDQKNRVKMMDDALRSDLLAWLAQWANRAQLCVAIGTSLCGMNADQVADAAVERFLLGSGEGLVIIGLQQTVYDEKASVRIWGLCDDVMNMLAKELGCKVPNPTVASRGIQWDATHPRLTYNTPTRSAKDPV
jgi:NAD-dependent SIR2 family protein deacetylase